MARILDGASLASLASLWLSSCFVLRISSSPDVSDLFSHVAKLWKPVFPEKEAFTRRESLTLRVIVALASYPIQMEVTLHLPMSEKVKKQGMRSNHFEISRIV